MKKLLVAMTLVSVLALSATSALAGRGHKTPGKKNATSRSNRKPGSVQGKEHGRKKGHRNKGQKRANRKKRDTGSSSQYIGEPGYR
jgi:hypothetical protein